MNFHDIKCKLGLSKVDINGFLNLGRIENGSIHFCLPGPFKKFDEEFIVCTLCIDKHGSMHCWGVNYKFEGDPDFVVKFMKKENLPLEILDPELGIPEETVTCQSSNETVPFLSKKRIVTYHGGMFRLSNSECAFFFCKRFAWGNERQDYRGKFVLPGEEIEMTWTRDRIVFTFENVVGYLRKHGYVYRR